MCGIGLIVSGVEFSAKNSARNAHDQLDCGSVMTTEHLLTALKRRGPDSVGSNVVSINLDNIKNNTTFGQHTYEDLKLKHMPVNGMDVKNSKSQVTLEFIATTLQLRGAIPVCQPFKDEHDNVLIFNGEIFDGIPVKPDQNDTQVLFDMLCRCCSCICHTKCTMVQNCDCTELKTSQGRHSSVPEILSSIRGPWALIFWQSESQILWFGRDVLGRRSLLVHWPSHGDERLVFCSVTPLVNGCNFPQESHDLNTFDYWEDLPCGIYSYTVKPNCNDHADDGYKGRLKFHEWENTDLLKVAAWERFSVEPPEANAGIENVNDYAYAVQVLSTLKESVRRRISNIFQHGERKFKNFDSLDMVTPVAILFSGGLDSMIIAALADQCLAPEWPIDLLNVSFEGQSAPDRISAIAGAKELTTISSNRRWRLVEVDGNLSCLDDLQSHILSLICPSKTHMDLNIGTALWLAARGHGWLNDGMQRKSYKSSAPVILVGSGADEQCAGYGRHRTKFREGGWKALDKEMRLDIHRLWKRNMGRDDRCIADHGKEARFPFLDEDVILSLLNIPLWYIADLRQPLGHGDKKILRQIASILGLKAAAAMPKRAIQFGSRIAQESNRRNFGSNRAANQASAGSATLKCFKIQMANIKTVRSLPRPINSLHHSQEH